MSALAKIMEILERGESSIETYDRHGEVAQRLSSRDLVDRIRQYRASFEISGSADRRIALLFRSEETADFLVATFSAIAAGRTVVPLYPNWSEAEQKHYLERYGLRTIAVGRGFAGRVSGWGDLIDGTIQVQAGSGPASGEKSPSGRILLEDLPDDHPCALIFTSGTSGELAKCTLITHANLSAAIENIGALDFLWQGMVLHCPLSASHIFAFVVILGFLGLGPRRVIFSDVQFLTRLPQEKTGKIDAMILIPLVLNRMRAGFYGQLANPTGKTPLARIPAPLRRILRRMVEWGEKVVMAREGGKLAGVLGWPLVTVLGALLGPLVRRRLGSPRFVVVGGAKPQLPSMAFLEVMGVRCLQGWGMTETTGPLAVCNLHDRFRGAFGTCGNLFPRTEAYLDGEELVVGGPQIAAGYVEPDGTLRSFGGKKHTGDLGGFDSLGRLMVLGKASDRITLLNGLNYNPLIYEEKIHALDLRREHKLEESVVIGDGQARLGCIFFLKESGQPSPEVREYLENLVREVNGSLRADDQIGSWSLSKLPLRDSGVLGPSAKIIRRRVEEMAAQLSAER